MATPLRVVPLVEPFLPAFAEGALLYARAHGTKPERVSRVAAICLRESWAGHAPGYRPKGSADGQGDWTARSGRWLKRSGVRIVGELPAGWAAPRKNGQIIPPPYAIPRDGLGWGRGLLQIDILGDFCDLIAPAPWPIERQAATACAQLALARQQLAPFATGDLLEMAIVCRYNAALERVRAGLDAGDPNVGTTGGDYGRDVQALETAIVARWPDSGIEPPGNPLA